MFDPRWPVIKSDGHSVPHYETAKKLICFAILEVWIPKPWIIRVLKVNFGCCGALMENLKAPSERAGKMVASRKKKFEKRTTLSGFRRGGVETLSALTLAHNSANLPHYGGFACYRVVRWQV